jgi:hypothetical protein
MKEATRGRLLRWQLGELDILTNVSMDYAPDNLERCPSHPEGQVRHVYDADFYVWPDGRRSAPMKKRTVWYECAQCCRKLALSSHNLQTTEK